MFYENFERLCKQADVSPSAAGLAIGMNKNAAGGWKKNHTIPKEDQLKDLASVLNCEVWEFFVDPDKPKYRNEIEMMEAKIASGEWEYASDLDDYQNDFLTIYESLSPKDRMRLMNMVYEFADEKGVEL